MATIHCCVHHFMFIHRWASSISVPILFKHIFNHFPFKSLCTKTRTTIFVWVMAGERCLNVWLLFVNIYLCLYLAKQNSNYLQFVITSAKHQYQAVLPTQEINTHNNLNHCDIISWITAWWDCYSRRAVIVWKRQVIIWGRGKGDVWERDIIQGNMMVSLQKMGYGVHISTGWMIRTAKRIIQPWSPLFLKISKQKNRIFQPASLQFFFSWK